MASIHSEETSRGRSWRVKWRERDGRQRTKSFQRKSDAQLFRAQVEAGLDPAPKTAPTTVQEVLTRYQRNRRAGRSTMAKETSLSKRLAPLLERPVPSLRASDVRGWVASLTDDGLAPETVSACLRLLRNVLDIAVDDDDVPANVAARVRPPRIVKPPLDTDDVLTVPEFEAILLRLDDRWRALFALRTYGGPRLSEALGLRREDIDLLHRRVHVGHRVLEEVEGVAELRDSGKTRGSDRWLPIPDRVVDLLDHHLSTYPVGLFGLIFTAESGGLVYRDNLRRRVWAPAVAAATIDGQPVTSVTMRNLRHTAASWMLAAGLDPLEVAYRVGHSRPSTTLDVYARFRPRTDRSDPYADVFRRNIGGTRAAE